MLRSIFLGAALTFSTAAVACPMADAAAFASALETVQQSDGAKAAFTVDGMHCGDCSEKVTAAVKQIDGVKAIAVDYQTGRAEVAFDDSKTTADKVLEAISATGFTAKKAPVQG